MSEDENTGETTAIARVTKAPPLTLGARLAKMDPAELDAACLSKIDALRALMTNPALPTEMQRAVAALVEGAAAMKPGMEEVSTVWKIPRIQIAQPTTTTAAKPEAAKNGELFTTAGQILARPHELFVFHFSYENVMFPTGAKVPACQAPDAKLGSPYGECVKCPHLPFGLQNGGKGEQKKTDCQNQIVAVVGSVQDPSQVHLVQFSKTSRRAGSALMSLAGQQRVPWAQTYLLTTERGPAEMGNYYVLKVEPTGRANTAPLSLIGQALCDLYTANRHRSLADHYRALQSAPAIAAAAEVEFGEAKLAQGLSGDVEPYDLGEPGPAAGSVRSSAKPM